MAVTRRFYSEGDLWIDFHGHLEVTVAQRGHFGT